MAPRCTVESTLRNRDWAPFENEDCFSHSLSTAARRYYLVAETAYSLVDETVYSGVGETVHSCVGETVCSGIVG